MRVPSSLILVFVLVVLAALATFPAQAKRPLTFQDMISLGRVGDPQISPDVKWVAYVVERHSLETNGRTSSLWLASLASGESRELTRPPQGKRDRAPRWAPDGQTLAFLSRAGRRGLRRLPRPRLHKKARRRTREERRPGAALRPADGAPLGGLVGGQAQPRLRHSRRERRGARPHARRRERPAL